MISLCQERWNSKDGSQTTNNFVTKGSRRPRSDFVKDLHEIVPDPFKKYVDWEQTKTEQGAWPTNTMVNMWFSNEASLPSMVRLLDIVKEALKKDP